jgi:hypothetical protein
MSKECNMQDGVECGEVLSYCHNSVPKSSSATAGRQFWKKFKMRQELKESVISCLVEKFE